MSLPLLALLSLAAPQAELGPILATETHGANVTIDGTDQVQVELPRFDETQGALLGVRLHLGAEIHRGLLAENTSREGLATTLELFGAAGVAVYGEEPFLLDLAQATMSHAERMNAYDGTLDYQGSSALGLHLQAATEKRRTRLGWGYEQCRDYVATEELKSLTLTLQNLDLTEVRAPGAEIAVDRLLTEATILIEYIYAPPLDDIVITTPEEETVETPAKPSAKELRSHTPALRGIGTLP